MADQQKEAFLLDCLYVVPQEADGHATYIRNVALALRERLAYSTLLEPCSSRTGHAEGAPLHSSNHNHEDARMHPGFPASDQATPSIAAQALQFTASVKEVSKTCLCHSPTWPSSARCLAFCPF